MWLTDSDLNVNLITAPDFDAYRLCTFKTAGAVTLAPSLTKRPGDVWPVNQIALGPPQKVISVTCSGTCIGVYGELIIQCTPYSGNGLARVNLKRVLTTLLYIGDCYNSTNGQYIGSCCNGFCAANKCRPWSTGSA